MNAFDLVTLAMTAGSAARGYRNGLSREVFRLFRMAVALVTGSGIYRWSADAVATLSDQVSAWAGPAVFVGASVLVWRLLSRFRQWSEAHLAARLSGPAQAWGGAVAAAVKTLALLGGAVGLFHLADGLPGHEAIGRDSLLARLLTPWLP
jgi:hypothetical protein